MTLTLGRVFVSRPIPEVGLAMLREHCDVEVYPDANRLPDETELIDGVRGKDALLCLLTEGISPSVMDAAPELKVISNYAVGYDNVDIAEATRRGIVVTNTPGVLTETTADFTWALLMATARRVVEADAYVRAGRFQGWGPLLLLGHDVYGKTIGIVGMGRIGEAVARRAAGFGMRIVYHNRTRKPDAEKALGATCVSLNELLSCADFVVITAPLTPDTQHLIGPSQLDAMKKSAYLINTARGPIVDEGALVDALQRRAIAGAGLDVFEEEPQLHPGLTDLPNVVMAPHIASASVETRERMAIIAAENVLAALRGNRPPHVVNVQLFNDDK